jgi:hypothetical protein
MNSFVLEKIGPILRRLPAPPDMGRRIAAAERAGAWYEVTDNGQRVGLCLEAATPALLSHFEGCHDVDPTDPSRCILLFSPATVAEIAFASGGPLYLVDGEDGAKWIYAALAGVTDPAQAEALEA